MVELVDTLDLGSSAARRESSSLSPTTKINGSNEVALAYLLTWSDVRGG